MMEFLLFLAVLALLACRCRRNHPGLKDLLDHDYAHRGLHGPGVPENSMAAFRAALEAGYGVELDLHLTKDGNVAVIHDSLLNRTTGCAGRIEDLTADQLNQYFLEGTGETIPLFSDVLELFQGSVPMIIELKPVDNNHDRLTATVCQMLESYRGVFCIESFDPRCLRWLKKHRPDIIRGQLTCNYFRGRSELPDYLKFLLTHDLLNFSTVPDFMACQFSQRKDTFMHDICFRVWHAVPVAWTLRSQQEYDTAKAEGWLPIFEGFRP